MSTAMISEPLVTADHLYRSAEERWRAHQTEDAAAMLEQALDLDAEHSGSLSLYGVCLASRGLEFKRALGCCRRAIQKDPHNVTFKLHMAKVYKLMGDHGAAYKLLLRTWRAHPKNGQAAAELARMGVRKQPPLPFLDRSHVLNRILGRARCRLRNTWHEFVASRRRQQARQAA